MMIIAIIGLIANIGAMFALTRGDVKNNLNMRGAYLHVLSDTLGSVAAIIAALIIYFTGWNIADPILSILISFMIAFSAFRLLKDTVHVLLEGTPDHIDIEQVKQDLLQMKGVENVHDLHIWTITSGINSLTVHLIVNPQYISQQDALIQANQYVRETLDIKHSTIQIETDDMREFEHPNI